MKVPIPGYLFKGTYSSVPILSLTWHKYKKKQT